MQCCELVRPMSTYSHDLDHSVIRAPLLWLTCRCNEGFLAGGLDAGHVSGFFGPSAFLSPSGSGTVAWKFAILKADTGKTVVATKTGAGLSISWT